jgi:hypothetical protein
MPQAIPLSLNCKNAAQRAQSAIAIIWNLSRDYRPATTEKFGTRGQKFCAHVQRVRNPVQR